MRRVIDEFRQLPMEEFAELLVYSYCPLEEDEDVYGTVRFSSNLFIGSYSNKLDAINAVIAYFERSL